MTRRRCRSRFLASVCAGVAITAVAAGRADAVGDGSATAPARAHAARACWPEVATDVDGGGPDVAVGLPGYDLPGKPDAGAVVVYSDVAAAQSPTPRPPRAGRIYTADDVAGLHSQAGARFGSAVSVWEDWGADDDADDCNDLLVGAPGQEVAGRAGAGAVYQLRGAPGGFAGVRTTFTEDGLLGTGAGQAGAHFGAAVAAEAQSALVVGAPGRDVPWGNGVVADAGRAVRVDGLGTDHEGSPQVIEEGGVAAGVPGQRDHFGSVLALMPSLAGAQLVVGLPDQDVQTSAGTRIDAGAIVLVPSTGHGASSELTQDSLGAGGAAESGDRFGAALDTYWTYDDSQGLVGVVAVGVPGEDVGTDRDAGALAFARFAGPQDTRATGPLAGVDRILTQDSPTFPGVVEAGDAFGSSVVTGPLDPSGGALDLAVGSALESIGRAARAGLVTTTRVEPDGSATPRVPQPVAWSQDSAGVPGTAESGDRFGAALSAVALTQPEDDDDIVWQQLIVTVPGEDVAGVVDAGVAYLGTTPGGGSVALVPPTLQTGAGTGMVPMRLGQQ